MIILDNDIQPTQAKIMKLGKKLGEMNIAIQKTLIADSEQTEEWIDLINEYSLFSRWLPFKRQLVRIRKWLGHLIKYQEWPGNKPSYVMRRGCSGMRDSHIQTYL